MRYQEEEEEGQRLAGREVTAWSVRKSQSQDFREVSCVPEVNSFQNRAVCNSMGDPGGQSKVSQTDKDKYRMVPLTCRVLNKERERERERD